VVNLGRDGLIHLIRGFSAHFTSDLGNLCTVKIEILLKGLRYLKCFHEPSLLSVIRGSSDDLLNLQRFNIALDILVKSFTLLNLFGIFELNKGGPDQVAKLCHSFPAEVNEFTEHFPVWVQIIVLFWRIFSNRSVFND
jgi:hypothetical protein